MNCSQCGKETPANSSFCNVCGCPISEMDKTASEPKQQSALDATEDIKKKLREIDKCKKAPSKKDSLKEEKLAAKETLIQNYPIPNSPKELVKFAKYLYSKIQTKKEKNDALLPVWKQKLEQVYLFAEKNLSSTEEFRKIQMLYNANKRRERHAKIRKHVVLFVLVLVYPILAAFIASLVFHWPFLLFASILAAGWDLFLILYVYDLFENVIFSMGKQRNIIKLFQFAAWLLLVPFIAALITAIVYQSEISIWLFAILFGVDAFFLVYTLGT